MQEFLERVDRFEQQIDDFGAGLQETIAQPAYQILDAVGHGGQPVQADLRRRTFDRVHRSEQPVDVLGVGIAFERQQTVCHGL